jgi:hypothetical protein
MQKVAEADENFRNKMENKKANVIKSSEILND